MNHGGEVEQHRTSVKDSHHVGGIRFLQATGFEQLIQHGVWIGIVFHLNHDTDALLGRLITDVSNTDHDFLVDQISDLNEHVCFLHLVGDFMNNDALPFVIVKDFTLRTNVESAFARGVHVGNTVDAVNGCTGGEIRALYVLHVFFYRDGWFPIRPAFKDGIDVKVHGSGHFREVVRRDTSRHTNRNTVASVEQEVGQSGREHRRFIL